MPFSFRSLIVALLFCASAAHADDDRAAAKAHYSEGNKRYSLSEFKLARDEFKAAYLAFPEPSFLFNIGQCSRMLGEPEEAIKAYRSYLRAVPETPNRAAVEKFITDEEKEITRRQGERAPAGTEPPKSLVTAPAAPMPAVVEPPAAEVAAKPVSPLRRWWWIPVVAGVVVVAAAVALAVAFTTPKDAPDPMTNLGVGAVMFK